MILVSNLTRARAPTVPSCRTDQRPSGEVHPAYQSAFKLMDLTANFNEQGPGAKHRTNSWPCAFCLLLCQVGRSWKPEALQTRKYFAVGTNNITLKSIHETSLQPRLSDSSESHASTDSMGHYFGSQKGS